MTKYNVISNNKQGHNNSIDNNNNNIHNVNNNNNNSNSNSFKEYQINCYRPKLSPYEQLQQ